MLLDSLPAGGWGGRGVEEGPCRAGEAALRGVAGGAAQLRAVGALGARVEITAGGMDREKGSP